MEVISLELLQPDCLEGLCCLGNIIYFYGGQRTNIYINIHLRGVREAGRALGFRLFSVSL